MEAHLEETTLRGSHLEGADLVGAYLKKANLNEAHLEGAHFIEANLTEANLKGAYLGKIEFEEVGPCIVSSKDGDGIRLIAAGKKTDYEDFLTVNLKGLILQVLTLQRQTLQVLIYTKLTFLWLIYPKLTLQRQSLKGLILRERKI